MTVLKSGNRGGSMPTGCGPGTWASAGVNRPCQPIDRANAAHAVSKILRMMEDPHISQATRERAATQRFPVANPKGCHRLNRHGHLPGRTTLAEGLVQELSLACRGSLGKRVLLGKSERLCGGFRCSRFYRLRTARGRA